MNNNASVKRFELLIVEDNAEFASFLGHHYAGAFKIRTAADGLQALEKINKSHPDLIISDIMMPGMDGYSLCNAVKDSLETSHIPVILLTARTDMDSRLEGLYKGADVYIDKPFNLRELDLQVRNILRARELMKNHFLRFDSIRQSVAQMGNKDQMFILKLSDIVHQHLDDGSFSVDILCREASVSRTLLHMKLKQIIGMSASEFIRKIRLNEAKKLLRENNLTVSEIAYRVGFNDPAYFSKSFKKMFGETPSAVSVQVSG